MSNLDVSDNKIRLIWSWTVMQ